MGSQGISCSPEQNKAGLGEEKENRAAPGRAVCSLKPLGFAGRMSQGQAVLRGRAESRGLLLRPFRRPRGASPLCQRLPGSRCSAPCRGGRGALSFSRSVSLCPFRLSPSGKFLSTRQSTPGTGGPLGSRRPQASPQALVLPARRQSRGLVAKQPAQLLTPEGHQPAGHGLGALQCHGWMGPWLTADGALGTVQGPESRPCPGHHT